MTWLDTIQFNADGLFPAIAQDQQTGRILMVAWMNRESLQLTAKTQTAVYFSRSRQQIWHKGETSGHTQKVHNIYLDCDADVIVLEVTQIGNIACHTGRHSCFYRKLDLTLEQPEWQVVDPVLKDPDEIYHTHSANHSDDNEVINKDSETVTNKDSETGQKTSNDKHSHVSSQHVLNQLDNILIERKNANPDDSYVASLYDKGLNKILEKVGEESTETILAAKELQMVINHLPEQDMAGYQKEVIYEVADVWFHTLVTLAWFNIQSDEVLAELARRFGLSGIAEKASRKK